MNKSIEMSCLVPDLPEAVAQIWDACGTTIESLNCTVGEKELEFFLERLIVAVGKAVHGLDYTEDVVDYLISIGYLDEGYHV